MKTKKILINILIPIIIISFLIGLYVGMVLEQLIINLVSDSSYKNEVSVEKSRFSYTCEDGSQIKIYDNGDVFVSRNGEALKRIIKMNDSWFIKR